MLMHGFTTANMTVTGKDITGAIKTTSNTSGTNGNRVDAGGSVKIVAGTGNTVEAPDDYELAGLADSEIASISPQVRTSTKTSVNITGSVSFPVAVDIKEVGVTTQWNVASNPLWFLILRDVLGSTVNVAAGGAIIVTYTLETTI